MSCGFKRGTQLPSHTVTAVNVPLEFTCAFAVGELQKIKVNKI